MTSAVLVFWFFLAAGPLAGQEARQADSWVESRRSTLGDPSPSRHRHTLGRWKERRQAPKSWKPLHCAMSQTQIGSDS